MLLLAFALAVIAKHHAVLLAGSNGYGNFRHQSDVCQMYQQLHANGIPDEHIYVWMYDDIANNPSNPKKGTIINYIGGPDVYKGVPKDFTGKDVTAANFLKFLRGENMHGIGSGKTLTSTKEDNLFIFYSDHGSTDLIAMPVGNVLGAKDLSDTLKTAYAKGMYKELIFYLEACESGSMFDKWIKPNEHIYAVTASTPAVSSWACDYDNGYKAYLNDCWSRNMMNDTRWAMQNKKMDTRTHEEQVAWVKVQTTQSPECIYGDLSIAKKVLSAFQGEPVKNSATVMNLGRKTEERVRPYDVEMNLLVKALENADGENKNNAKAALERHMRHRRRMDNKWNTFAEKMGVDTHKEVSNDQCFRADNSEVNHDTYIAAVNFAKDLNLLDDYAWQYIHLIYKAVGAGKSLSEMADVFREL